MGIVDRTGTMDHFNVTVRSHAFAGKTLIEQHQIVYGALKAALEDGRVHAVELKTIVDRALKESAMSDELKDEIAREIAGEHDPRLR